MKKILTLVALLPLALLAFTSCDAAPDSLADTVWTYEETRPDKSTLAITFSFDRKYLKITRRISGGTADPYEEEEIANYSYRKANDPNLKLLFGIGTEATGVVTGSEIATTEKDRDTGEIYNIVFKRKKE